SVGNVRERTFDEIWSSSPVLQELRTAKLGGRCGECEFSELCGGCRCRAYAVTGDFLAEDPSCAYEPGRYDHESIPMSPEKVYGIPEKGVLAWTPEAEARLKKIPFFARGMVKRAIESHAQEKNITLITEALMVEIREKMSGRFPR